MNALLRNWIAADGLANVEARLETQLRAAREQLRRRRAALDVARAMENAASAEVERIAAQLEMVLGRERAA